MPTETLLPGNSQAEHFLFITTRPSRNTQMPDVSQEVAARCRTEIAWAEKHGMDMSWLMQSGTQPLTTTFTTSQGHSTPTSSDDATNDDPIPTGTDTFTTSQGPNTLVVSDDAFSDDAVPVGPSEFA